MIFQELSVLPNLNVAENLFLAKEKKKGMLLDNSLMEKRSASASPKPGLIYKPQSDREKFKHG